MLFNLQVDTGLGGHGFIDDIDELLEDVEYEFGEDIKDEVLAWALNSKESDQFEKYGMIMIILCGLML